MIQESHRVNSDADYNVGVITFAACMIGISLFISVLACRFFGSSPIGSKDAEIDYFEAGAKPAKRKRRRSRSRDFEEANSMDEATLDDEADQLGSGERRSHSGRQQSRSQRLDCGDSMGKPCPENSVTASQSQNSKQSLPAVVRIYENSLVQENPAISPYFGRNWSKPNVQDVIQVNRQQMAVRLGDTNNNVNNLSDTSIAANEDINNNDEADANQPLLSHSEDRKEVAQQRPRPSQLSIMSANSAFSISSQSSMSGSVEKIAPKSRSIEKINSFVPQYNNHGQALRTTTTTRPNKHADPNHMRQCEHCQWELSHNQEIFL